MEYIEYKIEADDNGIASYTIVVPVVNLPESINDDEYKVQIYHLDKGKMIHVPVQKEGSNFVALCTNPIGTFRYSISLQKKKNNEKRSLPSYETIHPVRIQVNVFES